MELKTDRELIKIVHAEQIGRFEVSAMISRFGTLEVFVYDNELPEFDRRIWQGNSIIDAREVAHAKTSPTSTVTIPFYHDAGHGWGKVKRSAVKHFGVADKISNYSYCDGEHVYLEEDCDLGRMVDALNAKGYAVKFRDIDHGMDSEIRSMPRYTG